MSNGDGVRNATPPGLGGARDGVLVMVVAYLASWLVVATADLPVPMSSEVATGLLMGLVTFGRKVVQNRVAS